MQQAPACLKKGAVGKIYCCKQEQEGDPDNREKPVTVFLCLLSSMKSRFLQLNLQRGTFKYNEHLLHSSSLPNEFTQR